MTATLTAITAGSVITARPWRTGTELAPQRGIVLAETFGAQTEYAVVYFPGLGDPVVGVSVMPILRGKIEQLDEIVEPYNVSARFISSAYTALRRARAAGVWAPQWNAGGVIIETVHRSNLRARAAARA
jgi:hypothetical protein